MRSVRIDLTGGMANVPDHIIQGGRFALMLDNLLLKSGVPRQVKGPILEDPSLSASTRQVFVYRGKKWYSDEIRSYVAGLYGNSERVFWTEKASAPMKSVDGKEAKIGTIVPIQAPVVTPGTTLQVRSVSGSALGKGKGSLAKGTVSYRIATKKDGHIMPPSGRTDVQVDDGDAVLLKWGTVYGIDSIIIFGRKAGSERQLVELTASTTEWTDGGTTAEHGVVASSYDSMTTTQYAYAFKRKVGGMVDEGGLSIPSREVSTGQARTIKFNAATDGIFEKDTSTSLTFTTCTAKKSSDNWPTPDVSEFKINAALKQIEFKVNAGHGLSTGDKIHWLVTDPYWGGLETEIVKISSTWFAVKNAKAPTATFPQVGAFIRAAQIINIPDSPSTLAVDFADGVLISIDSGSSMDGIYKTKRREDLDTAGFRAIQINRWASAASNITSMKVMLNTYYTHRVLYRTGDSQEWMKVKEVPIEEDSFIDYLPASALSETPEGFYEDQGKLVIFAPPPIGAQGITEYLGMHFIIHGHRVRWTPVGKPDAYPPVYSTPAFPTRPVALAAACGGLIILTEDGVYRMDGSRPGSLVLHDTRAKEGCIAPFTVQKGNNGLLYLSRRGVMFFNGQEAVCLTDKKVRGDFFLQPTIQDITPVEPPPPAPVVPDALGKCCAWHDPATGETFILASNNGKIYRYTSDGGFTAVTVVPSFNQAITYENNCINCCAGLYSDSGQPDRRYIAAISKTFGDQYKVEIFLIDENIWVTTGTGCIWFQGDATYKNIGVIASGNKRITVIPFKAYQPSGNNFPTFDIDFTNSSAVRHNRGDYLKSTYTEDGATITTLDCPNNHHEYNFMNMWCERPNYFDKNKHAVALAISTTYDKSFLMQIFDDGMLGAPCFPDHDPIGEMDHVSTPGNHDCSFNIVYGFGNPVRSPNSPESYWSVYYDGYYDITGGISNDDFHKRTWLQRNSPYLQTSGNIKGIALVSGYSNYVWAMSNQMQLFRQAQTTGDYLVIYDYQGPDPGAGQPYYHMKTRYEYSVTDRTFGRWMFDSYLCQDFPTNTWPIPPDAGEKAFQTPLIDPTDSTPGCKTLISNPRRFNMSINLPGYGLLVVGGANVLDVHTATCEMLTTSYVNRQVGSLSAPRPGGHLVPLGAESAPYAVALIGGTTPTTKIEFYDIQAETWSEAPPAPVVPGESPYRGVQALWMPTIATHSYAATCFEAGAPDNSYARRMFGTRPWEGVTEQIGSFVWDGVYFIYYRGNGEGNFQGNACLAIDLDSRDFPITAMGLKAEWVFVDEMERVWAVEHNGFGASTVSGPPAGADLTAWVNEHQSSFEWAKDGLPTQTGTPGGKLWQLFAGDSKLAGFIRTGPNVGVSPSNRSIWDRIELHGRGTATVRLFVDGELEQDGTIMCSTENPSHDRILKLPRGTKGYQIDAEITGDFEPRLLEFFFSPMPGDRKG